MRRDQTYALTRTLPTPYQVLPEVVDLDIPGFSKMRPHGLRTFAVSQQPIKDAFAGFVETISQSHGRYLPVLRMSDGEYLFNFGFQPPPVRYGFSYPFHYVRYLVARFRPRQRMIAGGTHGGRPLYGSGRYSRGELGRIRELYCQVCKSVAELGILAMDLSFCSVPFQEGFFPALRTWLKSNRINLTSRNYVPFYFVYALLTGPERHRVLSGRRVLVIHSATGPKQDAIRSSLMREGAKEVLWHTISTDRSLYDVVPVDRFVGAVDLCVFGAGIGKPAILAQLEPLGVPCIDAGYVMEVWADPSVARSRIFTQPDDCDANACGTAQS